MPMEFAVPSLRIAVAERLCAEESEHCRIQQILKLESERLEAELISDIVQQRRKKFVDRHSKIRGLQLHMPVLLFNTRAGSMPGKLAFRWTGPYIIDKVIGDGTFLLRQYDGDPLVKPVNGFRLWPYHWKDDPVLESGNSVAICHIEGHSSQGHVCMARLLRQIKSPPTKIVMRRPF